MRTDRMYSYGTAQRQLDAHGQLTRMCLQSHTHFRLLAEISDCHGHALYEQHYTLVLLGI